MSTETTRRAVLTAIPLSAAALALPGVAAAMPIASAEWENVKRRFADAATRFDAACDAGSRVDGEQMDFDKTAPEREVSYSQDGWRIENAHDLIAMKGRNGAFILTRRNYRDNSIARSLRATPEYLAFTRELAAWESRREAYAEARGWQAAEVEWERACDARSEAWANLVGFPVETVSQIAEKRALACSIHTVEDEARQLLDAIGADFARLLPPGR